MASLRSSSAAPADPSRSLLSSRVRRSGALVTLLPILLAAAFLAPTAGCASEDDSAFDGVVDPASAGAAGAGGGAKQIGSGSAGNAGAAGASGAGNAGTGGNEASAAPAPDDDAGSYGEDDAKDPTNAAADAGFCSPTLVVIMPTSTMPASGKAAQANVRIHADTTGDDFGVAKNRYTASCGESGGTDVLVGLDASETGTLTLSLSGATEGFRGVLSVERGTCAGGVAASPTSKDVCSVADASGVATLSLDVIAGEHLFVFVDTETGHGGEFDLVASMAPASKK